MSFEEDKIEDFKKIFETSKSKIKASPGCYHVELLQMENFPNIFFTLSVWENEDALNNYRSSSLFENTWKKTKALFNDKPQAWSVNKISEG